MKLERSVRPAVTTTVAVIMVKIKQVFKRTNYPENTSGVCTWLDSSEQNSTNRVVHLKILSIGIGKSNRNNRLHNVNLQSMSGGHLDRCRLDL